eukprot:m.3056 g.3056  ORF g.3056 m.3056 type:complete len:852 (-) comp2011_c0_seq1:142-2697(-)
MEMSNGLEVYSQSDDNAGEGVEGRKKQKRKSKPSMLHIRGRAPVSGDESDGGEHGSSRMTRRNKERHGHRTLNKVTGEVKYKKVKSTELMSAIQMGVRQSIGWTVRKKKRDLLMVDFSEIQSMYYPKEGTNETPPHRYQNFKFYAYAPKAFRHFRDMYGIDTRDFLISMCDQPLRELSNPGASGSLFWLSDDDQFIVKTVQQGEHQFLLELLPQYYLNLHQNTKTLLPKYFGLFCYKGRNNRRIRFVVMNNILPSHLHYSERYDLKGSTKGRFASEKEKIKRSPTLKDLDFNVLHKDGIVLPPKTFAKLCNTAQRDCLILESYKIMDYSLLLGIHKLPVKESLAPPRSVHQFSISDTISPEQPPSSSSSQEEKIVILFLSSDENLNIHGRYVSGPVDASSEMSGNHPKKFVKKGLGSSPEDVRVLYLKEDCLWVVANMDKTKEYAQLRSQDPLPYPITNGTPPWELISEDGKLTSDVSVQTTFGRSVGVLPRRSKNRHSRSFSMSETIDDGASSNPEMDEGGLIAYNDSGEKLLVFIGIIDILQKFGVRKKIEHGIKSVLYDGDTVSVHKPKFYKTRFLDYLTRHVFTTKARNGKVDDKMEDVKNRRQYGRRPMVGISKKVHHSALANDASTPPPVKRTITWEDEKETHSQHDVEVDDETMIISSTTTTTSIVTTMQNFKNKAHHVDMEEPEEVHSRNTSSVAENEEDNDDEEEATVVQPIRSAEKVVDSGQDSGIGRSDNNFTVEGSVLRLHDSLSSEVVVDSIDGSGQDKEDELEVDDEGNEEVVVAIGGDESPSNKESEETKLEVVPNSNNIDDDDEDVFLDDDDNDDVDDDDDDQDLKVNSVAIGDV